MPIIPAAGLAKALVAVTISLHPAAAHANHDGYQVRPGDTLSDIANHELGSASDWPALWWANRHEVPNPSLITAGQRLRLPDQHQVRSWLARAASAATPAPGPVRARDHVRIHKRARGDLAVLASVRQRRELGRYRRVRVRRQLERRHRQRFLRRAPVQPGHLGCLRRRPVRGVRQRRQRGPADSRGRASARGPGHRRLAGLRRGRLIQHQTPPACTRRTLAGAGRWRRLGGLPDEAVRGRR